jgi:hypothetical protein
MSDKYTVQQIKTAVAALKAYKEKPFVKHQWEELVLRLSHDSDPCLREKMKREMNDVMVKDPGFSVFIMQ